MKSIARLIVAIPALAMATQSCVLGQQFPSTSHGGFDGSVVEIPEATLSLPNIGGSGSSRAVPTTAPSGINQVGGYQTVMDPTQVVLPPATQAAQATLGSSSRSVIASDPGISSSPIITVDPANGSQPVLSRSAPLPMNQSIIVEQAPTQFVESGQNYVPSGGEIFFENSQGELQGYSAAASSPGEGDFFIEDAPILEEVYQPSQAPAAAQRRVQKVVRQSRRTPGARSGGRVFSTVGASALFLNRNYGDNRNFATNGTDVLSSGNTEFDVLPGVDAFISRRRRSGIGWEGRYFGLYPADTSTQIGGDPTHLLPGLEQLVASNSPSTAFSPNAGFFFDAGDPHVLTRQTELHNVEFNLLRNAIPRLRATQTEFLIGFRYLNFGETLLHESIGVTSTGGPGVPFGTPESVGYFSTAENEMFGIQVGVRSDYQLAGRLMLHFGLKGGAFNNNINTRQRVDYRLPDGSVINPSFTSGDFTGRRFDIGAEDDVKSLVGEIDVAASLQLSSAARVRVGYRALGVSDVAFASDQIPDNFNDASSLLNPITDGNLFLQGTYVGLEFAY